MNFDEFFDELSVYVIATLLIGLLLGIILFDISVYNDHNKLKEIINDKNFCEKQNEYLLVCGNSYKSNYDCEYDLKYWNKVYRCENG